MRTSLRFDRSGKARPHLPVALLLLVVSLALLMSGCCGGCCRLLAAAGTSRDTGTGGNSGGPSEAPNSGSVSSVIAQQVGAFSLVGTAPVTRLGSGLSPGVIDSIGAVYSGPGGVQVNQIVLAYASADIARSRMETVYFTLARECPGKRLMRSNVTNREGSIIGTQVVCDQNPQHVYWSNGRILMFVTGPHPSALQFYNATGY